MFRCGSGEELVDKGNSFLVGFGVVEFQEVPGEEVFGPCYLGES